MHVFFLTDLPYYLWRLFISTKRAFHHFVTYHLVFGPLRKALEMEGIPANCRTSCSGITSHYLSLTYCASILFLIFIFILFDNDISSGHFNLSVSQKFFNFVVVNPTIGDNISKFFIIIFVSVEEGMILRKIEDVSEGVEGV